MTNLDKRTHWWNFTSSSSTDFDFPLPVLSNNTLSLSPSLSSGIPLKYTRILMAPTISLLNTLPFAFAYTKEKETLKYHEAVKKRVKYALYNYMQHI